VNWFSAVLIVALLESRVLAGSLVIVGFSAGSTDSEPGGVFVTSQNMSIDLGTRLYVGCFNDLGLLGNTINNYKNGTFTYEQTFADLTSNFVSFGGGWNYGTPNQPGTMVAGQFVFNNSSSAISSTGQQFILSSINHHINIFYGTIDNIIYSRALGIPRDIYMWTAFNNEIALVRNLDGIGTTLWTTPPDDFSSKTLNTSMINNQSEVLIGNYISPQVGSVGFIQTATPEPSSLSLLALGGVMVVLSRRKS